MPVSTTTTDSDAAADILLKILEQLEPIDSEQDRRIRAAIADTAATLLR